MGTELVARLFRPFTQADASTMRQYGGTGLGLSISQRLVQMMKGRISVQSSPGSGSEFVVELPLIETDPRGESSRPAPLGMDGAVASAGATNTLAPAGAGLILVAEDNETNRDVLLEQLRQLGYAVEVAVDGVQALALWRSGRHRLLLTDCHMPGMDGFELTETIRREEPSGTRLPIIAITADAMQDAAQRCMAHGMDDYLSKPLRMDQLAQMLAQWMPATGLAPSAPQTPLERPRAVTVPPAVVWDAQVLGRLVGHDVAIQTKLLTKFLVNGQGQLASLDTACASGDLQTLANMAHTLKSAANTVGAMALGALCLAVEQAGRKGELQACLDLAQQIPQALALVTAEINAHLSSGASAPTP